MTAALASVNFHCGQLELEGRLRESKLQQRIHKVQESAKRKLQEIHNGYTQASLRSAQSVQQAPGSSSQKSAHSGALMDQDGEQDVIAVLSAAPAELQCGLVCLIRQSASTRRYSRRSRAWRRTAPSCSRSTRRRRSRRASCRHGRRMLGSWHAWALFLLAKAPSVTRSSNRARWCQPHAALPVPAQNMFAKLQAENEALRAGGRRGGAGPGGGLLRHSTPAFGGDGGGNMVHREPHSLRCTPAGNSCYTEP